MSYKGRYDIKWAVTLKINARISTCNVAAKIWSVFCKLLWRCSIDQYFSPSKCCFKEYSIHLKDIILSINLQREFY